MSRIMMVAAATAMAMNPAFSASPESMDEYERRLEARRQRQAKEREEQLARAAEAQRAFRASLEPTKMDLEASRLAALKRQRKADRQAKGMAS